jgi:imidazoleglycerol phosphate dehydratase HisB/histidinol-phosphate/aromatic aminotransferase/cobyric acid decarboxylase-like protein
MSALDRWPGPPTALRTRMAQVYGVAPAQLLPVRGATHGLELVMRRAALDGCGSVVARGTPIIETLTRICGLRLVEAAEDDTGAVLAASPAPPLGELISPETCRALAATAGPALLVVDESAVEFSDQPSLAALAAELPNLVVLRSLSLAYGLAGARCGAVLAQPALVARLEEVLEPFALPTPTVDAALAALSPSRALPVQARIDLVRVERARLREALAGGGVQAAAGQGPWLFVCPPDPAGAAAAFARFGVSAEPSGDGFRLDVDTPDANDRALAALGLTVEAAARRRAESVRDTKETRIALTLDLDRAKPLQVRTGVGFYDHMLEQIASHGGFSLVLGCEGDLHIDPHHVVEDCALALGAALKQALGERRGIGRFGFVLPMDETEAQVSIDLGGRPFSVFEGAFRDSRIGDYPTEMTAHVFRSLAESLGAAIHVKVAGENDHHKTEACFKAFGRALRQAVRVEGSDIPSTKGVI